MKTSHRKNITMEQEYGVEKAKDIKARTSITVKESKKKYIKNYLYVCCFCNLSFTRKYSVQNKQNIFCRKECYYAAMRSNRFNYKHGFEKGHKDYNTEETKKINSELMKQRWKTVEWREERATFFIKNPEKHPLRKQAEKRKQQGLVRGFISSQQGRLYKIIREKFQNNFVEMEYPVKIEKRNIYLDVAVPDLKLNFEYDGEYWHQDKEKDLTRDNKLSSLGWKIFRINKINFREIDGILNNIIYVQKGV